MSLLEFARSNGVAMGSFHGGRHLGYTGDEAKAELLRAHGASVLGTYTASPESRNPSRVSAPIRGWEISISPGAEVIYPADVS